MFKFFKKDRNDEEAELSKDDQIAALMENAGVEVDRTTEDEAIHHPVEDDTKNTESVSEEAVDEKVNQAVDEAVQPVDASGEKAASEGIVAEDGVAAGEGGSEEKDLTDEELEALEKAKKEQKEQQKELEREEKARRKEAARAEKAYEKQKKKAQKNSGKYRDPELNIVKELFSLIIYIGIVIIACYLIIAFIGQRTTVHGTSMEPCLQNGDNLWIDKLSYEVGNPKRFDIVVFPYQDEEVYYIKRVIGLPGETIQILDSGEIVINGVYLKENYGLERMTDNGIAGDPITLGEDEYFVLGDNRNNSRDSRWADVGPIKKDKLIGKAAFRLSPFEKFGKLD